MANITNNLQALTAMTRELRSRKYNNGLILANGGMLTHQYVVCLSAQPRKDGKGYPAKNPLPPVVQDPAPPFVEDADGPATIEVSAESTSGVSRHANNADVHD